MAEAIIPVDPNGQVDTPRVWTLEIVGGQSFTVRMPMTPLLIHDGSRTLWKMHGTESEMREVVGTLRESSQARVTVHTEVQTPEQAQERQELLGVEVLPTPAEVLEELDRWGCR